MRVRREQAVVLQPRDVGQRPARLQDAPDLAQRARAVRDELEDERRECGVERAIREREGIGEGDDRPEASALRTREQTIGLGIGHAGHLGRGVSPDDRHARPASDGAERQLAGPGPDVDEPLPAGEGRLSRVEQLGDGGCEDRRPPTGVSRRDPVVAFGLVGHRRMVPRRAGPRAP